MKKFMPIFTAIIVIVGIVVVNSANNKKKKERDEKVQKLLSVVGKSDSNPEVVKDYKTQLEESFVQLKEDEQRINQQSFERPVDIVTAAEGFDRYVDIIEASKADSNKQYIKKANELKTSVIACQKRVFPRLRSAFHKYISDVLWQADVEVIENTKGGTSLTFIGSHYTANKNKQSTQDSFHKYFMAFRYKRINYKWYKGENEYTYYEISSKKDTDL